MTTIKLTQEHRGLNSTTFTGRPQGKEVRINLKLSEQDNLKEIVYIEIPKGTTSFNPSFYLGLFYDSISFLGGLNNFKNKYKIIYADNNEEIVDILKENINDCERQAAREYKRNSNK